MMTNHRINQIERLKNQSERISKLMRQIGNDKLMVPLKDGGWSVNQIIHHITDAHLHAFMRIKWIYTEHDTILKAFDQDKWVDCPDIDTNSASDSLQILSGICSRWGKLSENLSDKDWKKTGIHPESGVLTIEEIFDYFVNHAETHIKQISDFGSS